ncbi:AAA family ATPase [Actinoplanes subtropicus]|uniref:AAA family ATPase n=1 Tax=Actinoplanes subtropicus TaxID=543632 RepID=UPI00068CC8C3|nr:AAA family ATPase [Actinoplanes subtropicus]
MTDDPYRRVLRALRDRGLKVTESGQGTASVQCPVHDDHNASATVSRGDRQPVVFSCLAGKGCTYDDAMAALGLDKAALADRAENAVWTPYGDAVAVYPYRDEAGVLLYEVCRTADKQFPVRVPDPIRRSGYRWKLAGVRRVLYRLPEVIAAVAAGRPVFVAEGEKDVAALVGLGLDATCNPGGAGGGWRPEYSEFLRGANVMVIADADANGRKHARKVRDALADIAATVEIAEPADGCKDVTDHVAKLGGLDGLRYADDLTDEATTDVEPSSSTGAEVKPSLTFSTVAELRARVRAAGPRRWLLRGLWPAGDYGVHAGEMKAQKSWNTVAVAVAVASGTPWLGAVDVDLSGPVVMFAGEGGEADLLRRIDAIAAAAGIDADELPITICARAPHLRNIVHLGEMADQIDRVRPVMVTLDPLYLSAGGAKGSDLYAMGELLEKPQHLCQAAGSSLWVTTHTNRKEGRGASRITGAGPAEWGRVLATATVKSRKVDKVTRETTVITELDFIGGSIPGGTLRTTRRIRADDPDDLDSPLHCWVKAEFVDEDEADTEGPKMPPSRAKLLEALRHFSGAPVTVRTLVDHISTLHGHGLTRETCSRELNALLAEGYADRIDQGKGSASEWFVTADGQAVNL